MAQIFNKSAIEKMSSPEQLDKALKVTSPLSWLVLLALSVVVAVTVVWSFLGKLPVTVTATGVISDLSGVVSIYAPESGKVVSIAENGATVGDGSSILTYEDKTGAPKTIVLSTASTGTVQSQIVKTGDDFEQQAELIHITPNINGNKIVVGYVSASDINKIKSGMTARVYLTSKDKQKYGYMTATVIHVNANETTEKGFTSAGVLTNMATEIKNNKAVVAVVCELEESETSRNGYSWSNKYGNELTPGEAFEGVVRAEIKVITEEIAPIEKFINNLKEKWGN